MLLFFQQQMTELIQNNCHLLTARKTMIREQVGIKHDLIDAAC